MSAVRCSVGLRDFISSANTLSLIHVWEKIATLNFYLNINITDNILQSEPSLGI